MPKIYWRHYAELGSPFNRSRLRNMGLPYPGNHFSRIVGEFFGLGSIRFRAMWITPFSLQFRPFYGLSASRQCVDMVQEFAHLFRRQRRALS